jgi:hypothetical protein
MQTLDSCPLCNFTASRFQSGPWRVVNCTRCGEFALDSEARELIEHALPQTIRALQQQVVATKPPLILTIVSRNPAGSALVDLVGKPQSRSAVVA